VALLRFLESVSEIGREQKRPLALKVKDKNFIRQLCDVTI